MKEMFDTFVSKIISSDSLDLADEYVSAETVHAFKTAEAYTLFRDRVKIFVPEAEYVSIVGSGNWRFSLNPDKLLTEFNSKSDIDIAVVSMELYSKTWEYMRQLHRQKWYSLSFQSRDRLVRYGQDIYSGFACPVWIPAKGHPYVYWFKSMLNKLSCPEVGYREVKMLYFKNKVEMFDYYCRGFAKAKRELAK